MVRALVISRRGVEPATEHGRSGDRAQGGSPPEGVSEGDRADSNRLAPGSQPGPSTASGSVTAEAQGVEPCPRERGRLSKAVQQTDSCLASVRTLHTSVERRGIEPRFPGCKPGVVPLDQRPMKTNSSRGENRTRKHQALDLTAFPICVPDRNVNRSSSCECGIEPQFRAYETQWCTSTLAMTRSGVDPLPEG
jgi:hypothetical protein